MFTDKGFYTHCSKDFHHGINVPSLIWRMPRNIIQNNSHYNPSNVFALAPLALTCHLTEYTQAETGSDIPQPHTLQIIFEA